MERLVQLLAIQESSHCAPADLTELLNRCDGLPNAFILILPGLIDH